MDNHIRQAADGTFEVVGDDPWGREHVFSADHETREQAEAWLESQYDREPDYEVENYFTAMARRRT